MSIKLKMYSNFIDRSTKTCHTKGMKSVCEETFSFDKSMSSAEGACMQGIVVGVIVLLAFLFFLRRVRSAVRSKGGCGCGCSGCSRRIRPGTAACSSLKKAGD